MQRLCGLKTFKKTQNSMGDLKIISSLKDIIYGYWNSLPDSALEENEVAESCYRWLEKQGHTDGIIEKAKTEKQRVIITETDGNANIDWDTRSLADTKKLLEYGLDFINKKFEKQGEQQHAWSKEDEIRLDRICKTLWKNRKGDTDEIYQQEQDVDFLKSLKQRNIWKPSDEQMKALHDMNLTGNISYAGQGQVLIELYNDLKKL